MLRAAKSFVLSAGIGALLCFAVMDSWRVLVTNETVTNADQSDFESPPAGVMPPTEEMVTLLVAKKDIEMHTPLRNKPEDYFQTTQVAKGQALKDALTQEDFANLNGKYTKRSLHKGDCLLAEDLMVPRGKGVMGPIFRTVIFRATFPQQFSGPDPRQALPGSHVDIVWTYRGNPDNPICKVLVEDVVVIAMDSPPNNDVTVFNEYLVTVSVEPDDAMKLSLAMDLGSLHITPRFLNEPFEPVSLSDLLKERKGK